MAIRQTKSAIAYAFHSGMRQSADEDKIDDHDMSSPQSDEDCSSCRGRRCKAVVFNRHIWLISALVPAVSHA